MAIEFSCPICGKRFRADERMAGKRARCGACRGTVTVPIPPPPEPQPEPEPEPEVVETDEMEEVEDDPPAAAPARGSDVIKVEKWTEPAPQPVSAPVLDELEEITDHPAEAAAAAAPPPRPTSDAQVDELEEITDEPAAAAAPPKRSPRLPPAAGRTRPVATAPPVPEIPAPRAKYTPVAPPPYAVQSEATPPWQDPTRRPGGGRLGGGGLDKRFIVIGIVAILVLVAAAVVIGLLTSQNRGGGGGGGGARGRNSGGGVGGGVAHAGEKIEKAVFPPRQPLRALEGGVQFCDVRLTGRGPGQRMTLWLYLPPGTHASRSLPCVLVGPAGSPLVWGMSLGDGDRPEHLPYAQAGFAVLAYELDGAVADSDTAGDAEVARAIGQFIAAEGGVANARTAMEYLSARVPEVDPGRIYCAGHSSAGTLALQLAALEPGRIKGCVAYAPAVDIEGHQAATLDQIEQVAPGTRDFARRMSPINLPRPGCPVMLFHAEDDTTVSPNESRRYISAHVPNSRHVVVTSGGHYDSMIQSGIPAGITFLKDVDGRVRETAIPAKPPKPAKPDETPSDSGSPLFRPCTAVPGLLGR